MEHAFDLHEPACQTTAFVFSSPHSGRDYPRDFLARSVLPAAALRSSEDAFVDHLFDAAPRHGAPLLAARHPRAWLDLNRAPDELDPALIEDEPRGPHNPRISSGLGVIPRVVSGGRHIYHGKIPRAEALSRLTTVWQPYHDRLSRLLRTTRQRFGRAVLIDCHSMPHEALDGVRAAGRRPDVVLGDRYGTSAAPDIVDEVARAFADAGFVVSRNAPFAGAHIAQAYGRPARHSHVVQVEIDRALYMDETAIAPHGDFAAVKSAIDTVVAGLCDLGRPAQMAHAAE